MAITLNGNGTSTFSNNITSSTGDLTLGDGNLVVADGHGIDFSATADGAGTNIAELLDDYEEGRFTPAINGGSTYTTQEGTYTKIGNRVWVNIFVQVSAIPGAGILSVSGLPFASLNQNRATTGYGRGWTNDWASGASSIQWIQGNNQAVLEAFTIADSNGVNRINASDMGASGNIIIQGSYIVR